MEYIIATKKQKEFGWIGYIYIYIYTYISLKNQLDVEIYITYSVDLLTNLFNFSMTELLIMILKLV